MSEISPFKGKSGLKRILNATQYSLDGFKAAYQNEAAFRQIVWMNIGTYSHQLFSRCQSC